MLSTFTGKIVHEPSCDASIVSMKVGEQICLAGAAKVAVLSGSIQVLGYTLSSCGLASPHLPSLLIHSPFWESCVCLTAVSLDSAASALHHACLAPQPLSPALVARAVAMLEDAEHGVLVAIWDVDGAAACADGYQIDAREPEVWPVIHLCVFVCVRACVCATERERVLCS